MGDLGNRPLEAVSAQGAHGCRVDRSPRDEIVSVAEQNPTGTFLRKFLSCQIYSTINVCLFSGTPPKPTGWVPWRTTFPPRGRL